MLTIVAISGSLRSKSFNTMLLEAVVAAAPAGTTIAHRSIAGIPLYNADLDGANTPAAVRELKEHIAAAAGLLLVSPEYNHSIPGVLKNAIDWLSRPAADISRVFRNRPVGVIGASTGPGGTTLGQEAWLPVLRGLGMAPFCAAKLMVAHAGTAFDETGTLRDPAVHAQLGVYLAGFVQFVARNQTDQRKV